MCLRALVVSVQLSRSAVSDSLWPHGLQNARLCCSSPTSRACSNSCPLSRWCHPTISASVIPFSSRLQSFPASGSFPMSQFFALGGQSIRVSASTSVHPMNTQDCIYICNCYIFFLDRSHYVMSFLISCNSLYFKVYFIWHEYHYSHSLEISICMEYVFQPLLSVCSCP